MASKFYLKNPSFFLNGHDFSDLVKGVDPSFSFDQLDVTASGDGGHKYIQGLEKSTFKVDLYQDADLGNLDNVIADMLATDTAVVCEITAAGSTVSTSNPSWTGNVKVFDYQPLGGVGIGAVVATSVTFVVDGTTTRAGT